MQTWSQSIEWFATHPAEREGEIARLEKKVKQLKPRGCYDRVDPTFTSTANRLYQLRQQRDQAKR